MKTVKQNKRKEILEIKEVLGKDVPAEVKEAIEAMKRTKMSRINKPVFQIPNWGYARLA